MSAHGEVLNTLRHEMMKVGWSDPVGLTRRAMDFLGVILKEGREPTYEELMQTAALITVAAEVRLIQKAQSDPNV